MISIIRRSFKVIKLLRLLARHLSEIVAFKIRQTPALLYRRNQFYQIAAGKLHRLVVQANTVETGKCLLAQGKANSAEAMFKREIAEYPKDISAYWELGKLMRDRGM